jgi:hypothetical protein
MSEHSQPASFPSRLAYVAVRGLPWTLVVLLTAANLFYIGRLGPNDDAFITYRVARNLATGLGPVFNPGERVLSITTPGYMLLLAAVSPLSQDFAALGLMLNGLGLLAIGALLIDLSTQSAPADRPRVGLSAETLAQNMAALIAVALVFTFPLLSESVGMETPLYVAALLAVFAAYRRALAAPTPDAAQRWLLVTAAAAAAAFLIRPDGLLAGLVVGAHWLATRRRVPWLAVLVGTLIAMPWMLFAWGYYGSPVPNTLMAKMTQGLSSDVPRWGAYLLVVAREWGLAQPAAAVLAVCGLIATLRRPAPLYTVRRLMVAWAALAVLVHTLLDVRGYFWYYVPLAPVVALLAGDGVAWLVRVICQRVTGSSHSHGLTAHKVIAGAAILLLAAAILTPASLATGRLVAQQELRQRDVAYQKTALVLRALCQQPGQGPVAVAEIGLLGYLSQCAIVDFSGLLQPELAHLRAEAADKMAWVMKRYAPPLVVLSGSDGFPHQVVEPAWFRRRYEPFDIQDEGGFQSVIYQRGPGVPEQRDLGAASWWQPATLMAGRSLSLASGQPVTTSLEFPLGVSPAITLHAYLPPDSGLAVAANGQPLAEFTGAQAGWSDFVLPLAAVTALDQIKLELAGTAGEQPAAVAWIESNALPAVHFFQPLDDLSQRPRPRLGLPPGTSRAVELAAARLAPGAAQIEMLHRDRPGVALVVMANGQTLATVGGADGWRTERIDLPSPVDQRVTVELRSQGSLPAEVVYVALTDRVAEFEGRR